MTVPPDTLTVLWELAKIVVGVSVASMPPLLVWIGRLLNKLIEEQRRQARELQSEDGQDGLIPKVRKLEGWQTNAAQELAALTGHVGDLLEWQYREQHGERKPHTTHHPGRS